MKKTIEATWRDGFLDPNALVAPKVNDLYTRKSMLIVDRIQRMQRINEVAILIGAPIAWAWYSSLGMPYGGAILFVAWVGLVVVRRQFPHIRRFDAPVGADSYHYVTAFQQWLRNRLAWGRQVQGHLYAVSFVAIAIGIAESESGHRLIRTIVDNFPGMRTVYGVPVVLIVAVVAVALVVDRFGGAIFDFDVKMVYRGVFEKLDQMVAEMEELRG